jgi:hypothetical protein
MPLFHVFLVSVLYNADLQCYFYQVLGVAAYEAQRCSAAHRTPHEFKRPAQAAGAQNLSASSRPKQLQPLGSSAVVLCPAPSSPAHHARQPALSVSCLVAQLPHFCMRTSFPKSSSSSSSSNVQRWLDGTHFFWFAASVGTMAVMCACSLPPLRFSYSLSLGTAPHPPAPSHQINAVAGLCLALSPAAHLTSSFCPSFLHHPTLPTPHPPPPPIGACPVHWNADGSPVA